MTYHEFNQEYAKVGGLERALLGLSFEPGMTAIDIGASEGIFTRMLCERADTSQQVIAFEPSQQQYESLRQLDTQYPNLEIHNIALSKVPGIEKLYLRTPESGQDHALVNFGEERQMQLVKIEPLNEYHDVAAQYVIKMDVEGAEGLVIEGGMKFLQHAGRIRWMLEFSPSAMLEYDSYCGHKFLELFLTHGYRILEVQHGGRTVREITAEGADTYTTALQLGNKFSVLWLLQHNDPLLQGFKNYNLSSLVYGAMARSF
ncbi:FkbM family methyltransferase [Candidatus Woesearchaeota archaeon]|nr:FkbM family methyltransferase [Candidatus Woesearchaeota archaeon]